MTAASIPFVDKRSWKEDPTAVLETKPDGPREQAGELNALPVPEHLHRLWMALGLDDE